MPAAAFLVQWVPVRGRRAEIVVCLGVFLVLIVWMSVWRYTGEGDSILHYLNAREATVQPWWGLNAWARPVFKLLIVLPCLKGVVAARVWMAFGTALLVWQTMRLAGELGMRRAWMAGLLLMAQPLVFALGSDTMSELPFALGMVAAVRLWMAGKRRAERVAPETPAEGPTAITEDEAAAMIDSPAEGPVGASRRAGIVSPAEEGTACRAPTGGTGLAAKSSLLVGLLVMVRPEAFLLCAMWVAMALTVPWIRGFQRRLILALLPAGGLVLWAIACQLILGNWRYFIDNWSWPASSYEGYVRGSLFHHLLLWPWYCGWLLFPLFLLGIGPSLRRRGMGLLWIIWLGVFVGHSIFYWQHWLASAGLMRILATTSPVTALICLEGWNRAAAWLDRRAKDRPWEPALVVVATAILAVATVVFYYVNSPQHYRFFGIEPCAHFIRQHKLLGQAPKFFASDKIIVAELGLPPDLKGFAPLEFDPRKAREALAELPPGSIGLWDNQLGQKWYGLSIAEVEELGFEPIFESDLAVKDWVRIGLLRRSWTWVPAEWREPRVMEMRYVVLRKPAYDSGD